VIELEKYRAAKRAKAEKNGNEFDNNAIHLHGIKRYCVLNKLNNFHMTACYSNDIMHDLYEGIVPTELALILQHFIFDEGYFQKEDNEDIYGLEMFNKLTQYYNYGPIDHKNKPGSILENPTKKLKTTMKAAKMACLIRYLPFIIGKRIPANHKHWQLFTLLSRIIDYAHSTHLTIQNTHELEKLVIDHHTLYKKLFSDVTLKKKHHNLVHYAKAIQMYGNLVDCNGVRFEAKHTASKAAAQTARNSINLPKTVATKIQVEAFYNLLTDQNLSEEVEIVKSKKMVYKCYYDEKIEPCFIKLGWFFTLEEEIVYDITVKVFSQAYSKNQYIIVKKNDITSISLIRDILFVKNELVLFVQYSKIIEYNNHFCAYEIKLTNSCDLIKKENIYSYKPFVPCCVVGNNDAIFVKPYSHVNLR
jgi:hypothetical protein